MQATQLQWNSAVTIQQLFAAITHPGHLFSCPSTFSIAPSYSMVLVEWVRSGAPVGEEHAEANCLEQARNDTDSNLVDWTLLSDDL